MARQLRLEYEGALYHVTARGNARQAIYLDDTDRRRFLDLLGREVEQQQWHCYAYCLMDNHYHLLLETPEGIIVGNTTLCHSIGNSHGDMNEVNNTFINGIEKNPIRNINNTSPLLW